MAKVNIHIDDVELHRLADFIGLVLAKELRKMTQALDDLAAQVQANTDVTQSAVQLINSLADQIADAGGDSQKLADLTRQLRASATTLGSAVAANTVAATPPADPNAAPVDPNAPVTP